MANLFQVSKEKLLSGYRAAKLKALNVALLVMVKLLLKEMGIMTVTFADGNVVKELQLAPEDVAALGEQFLKLTQAVMREEGSAKAMGLLIKEMVAAAK